MKTSDKEDGLDKLSLGILILSAVIILFSFVAPVLFIQKSPFGIDFSHTGSIGDTIGGLMNPFIATAGVFLTFLAFYIQYRANQLQKTLFRQELDSNKFENQFYEMLKLHKENVNEISITLNLKNYSGKQVTEYQKEISGRAVFKYFLLELRIIYHVAKKIYSKDNKDKCLNRAYKVFFSGISFDTVDYIENETDRELYKKLLTISEANDKDYETFLATLEEFSLKCDYPSYYLFAGQSVSLAHYYRHLFQTVKFIVNQNEKFIDYSGKRNYLRILRAQLSNQEQAMLFYNWKSDFGFNWENNKNKFFTDYRMIHNLYNDLIFGDFDLAKIFSLDEKPYYKVEPNRSDDKLFEFQDW